VGCSKSIWRDFFSAETNKAWEVYCGGEVEGHHALIESFRHFRRMQRALCIHSHSHSGCTWVTLSAGGKKSTYAHKGTFYLSTTEHLPCLMSFHGKKSRQILFEQPTYAAIVQHIFLHITISIVHVIPLESTWTLNGVHNSHSSQNNLTITDWWFLTTYAHD
jgi:hypothetical protein